MKLSFLAPLVVVFSAVPAAAAAPDCFDSAASYQGVNPWVLRAITYTESRFNPQAKHRNSNGSLDIGATQINSVHFDELSKYGIQSAQLYDGCTSVYVAAWLLKRKILKHGNTWTAVGAYHSETPKERAAYAARVQQIIGNWQAKGFIQKSE